MTTNHPESRRASRPMAVLLSVLLGFPLFSACASEQNYAPPPPVDDSVNRTQPYPGRTQPYPGPANSPKAKRGLSTGQKVAILAGAAALYYLYNQHKNRQAQGAQGKYYLSKNGRVYYRDAQGRAHWVTPPPGGIQVPEEEAQQYRDFQGYNGRQTGRDLTDLVGSQGSYQDRYPEPVPAR